MKNSVISGIITRFKHCMADIENPKTNVEGSPEPEKELTQLMEETKSERPLLDQIQDIDPEKPLEEAEELLEQQTQELILLALKSGFKPAELKKSPFRLTTLARTEEQKEVANILAMAFQAQPKESFAWFQNQLIKAQRIYEQAVEKKEKLERAAKAPKDKKEKTPGEGKDWMSPGLQNTLIVAGAVGAGYFIFKYLFGNKDSKGHSKTSDLVMAGVMSTVAVGTLIGGDQIGKWAAEYANLSVSSDALRDAWDKVKNFKNPLNAFVFSTREPGIREASKELKISERAVMDLSETKWSEFNSFKSDISRTGESYLHSALEIAGYGNVPFLSADDELQQAKEEVKLSSFIRRNQDRIEGDINNMTIGEILAALATAGVFGKEKQGDEDGKDDENNDETETSASQETAANLKNLPHAQAAYTDLREGRTEWDEGISNIIEGAVNDGAAIGVWNGFCFIVKGATLIPLSSLEIVSGQVSDFMDAMAGDGSWTNVLLEKQQVYWMGTFAAIQGGKALFSGKPVAEVVTSTFKGAGKGLVESYIFLPKAAVKAYKWKMEGGDQVKLWNLSRQGLRLGLSPEEKIWTLHQEARFNAERYTHYFDEIKGAKKLTGLDRHRAKLYEKVFRKDWLEKMMLKSAKRFLESEAAFMKAVGKTSDLEAISHMSVEGDPTVRDNLAMKARKFSIEHPESELPKRPAYRVTKPKYSTHAEASKEGSPRLNLTTDQQGRMKALGLDHERITLKMREFKMSRPDVEQLLRGLEAGKSPQKAAHDLEVLMYRIKNPRLISAMKGAGSSLQFLAVLKLVYDMEQSKDLWDTTGENLSATGAFLLGGKMTSAAIPHPVGKVVGYMAGGTVGAFGGAEAWNQIGRPYLQMHFPNRQKMFEGKGMEALGGYLSALTGGITISSAMYGLDAIGLGDGIDEETDPLDYLKQTTYTVHSDYIKQVFEGEKIFPYGEHRKHDTEDLVTNAKEALTDAQDQILTEQDPKKLDELHSSIERYQSYIDGSWVEIKRIELVYRQTEMIEPVFAKFMSLVDAKFGPRGKDAFVQLVQRLQKGEQGTNTDLEMDVWQFLCDEKVDLGEGNKLSFADFATFVVDTYQSAVLLEQVEKEIKGQSVGESLDEERVA